MFVSQKTHEAAIQQLQSELAAAKAEAARNAQTASYYNQEAQKSVAALAAEKQEHEKTQRRVRDAQKQQEVLAANLAQLAGPSPFIRLGKERFLFTQIHRMTVSEKGEVEKVNDLTIWETVLAEDLERLVSAFYKRAQTPPTEQ